MKKIYTQGFFGLFLTLFLMTLLSCGEKTKAPEREMAMDHSTEEATPKNPKKPLSEDFKGYWYAGDAEITSYQLEQARYGEIHEGHAVLIYVTEPFLADVQVKADGNNPDNVSVLKLNATKKFLTGIYPYSIMGSTFYPVHDNQHAIKTSLSVQEWCGHVYSQINNRNQFEFTSHSYFEGEADQNFMLDKQLLENEIWTKIRIHPEDLPTGNLNVIPSLEYLRLAHKELKAYEATASVSSENGITTYTLSYPKLERILRVNFTSNFPYAIESWTEESKSGFGANAKTLTTKAIKMKSIKTAYWGQHDNDDLILRDSLRL
ncbi:septum formation inhibitor Maf [Muricauda sp. CAU 1633]|uniref:septum formation inhibitor Maf n=1 Tax=Allomuricauda sp. CAU 1633 TaxID=2816036 RepID=UPI001A8F9B18|nr:septum formation inhibitor Maf [Muricauda sp. CAU 1633]MBO0323415.1 septum formation inhibitor Maf [Muricauda sp. CAU 1633]